MTRPIARSSIVTLALTVAACGGSTSQDTAAPGAATTPPGASASRGAASGSSVDACALVTQADATALFGQPAARQASATGAVPMMIGECLWTWDAETANQLLQFRVWSSTQGYSRPADEFTTDLTLGERAHVRAHPQGGVDVEWVQGGRMFTLSYSKVGSAVASPTTKTEAVVALAKKMSGLG